MAAVAVRVVVSILTDYTYEDALITYRYVQNLVDGHGFVYNLGERVLGTTTPLYTLIVAGLAKGGLDIFTAGRVINVVSDGLTACLVAVIVARFGRFWLAIVAGVLYALSPPHVAWAISGMETALFGFLSLLALCVYIRGKTRLASFLTAIAVLIRPDGLILVGVMFVHYMVTERRVPWREMAICGAVLLPWVVFASAYFGTAIPQSLIAKATVYSAQTPSVLPNLMEIMDKFWYRAGWAGRGMLLSFMVGAAAAMVQPRLSGLLLLAGWFFAYYAVFIASRTHLHGWYLVPPLSVFIAISVLGLGILVEVAGKARKLECLAVRWGKASSTAIVIVVVLASILPFRERVVELTEVQRYEEEVRKPVGLWLRENTTDGAVIFLEPIGYIGFYSERYILDDTGLVSPQMLTFSTSPRTQLCAKLKLFQPDFAVFRQGDIQGGALCGSDDVFFEVTYQEMARFQPQSGSILVAPEEAILVVFARRDLPS